MTNARWSIVAVFLACTLLTGIHCATAQGVVKAEDVIGTWELVSTKDVKTGEAMYGYSDASTGLQVEQYSRSHYTMVAMTRDRSVISPADFAKLSPEEQVKTNYARVWNEKNKPIFAANGGTYTVEGDEIHKKPMIALNPAGIGNEIILKVTHLDRSTMVFQHGTIEHTFRRIE